MRFERDVYGILMGFNLVGMEFQEIVLGFEGEDNGNLMEVRCRWMLLLLLLLLPRRNHQTEAVLLRLSSRP